jgi:hypothetical protein
MSTSSALQVFISYDRRDLKEAKEICEFIRDCHCAPLIDYESMLPGDRWRVKSMEDLQQSQAVVLVLSPHSVNSRNTVYEEFELALQLARKNELVVIPICVFPVSFPADIAAFHIEYWNGRGKTTLRKKLKQLTQDWNAGALLGGLTLASLVAGGIYLWKKRQKKQTPPPRNTGFNNGKRYY